MAFEEDFRRHVRIREEIPVRWQMEGTNRSGDGIIRDISVSGVLVEINTFFTPVKDAIYVLKAVNPNDELMIPEKGRLVWSRSMKTEMGKFFCGLEFVRPSDSIVAQITKRVEEWFVNMAEAANVNILDNYFHGRNKR